MAQATLLQEGETIDYTPGSAVDGGDIVVQGNLIGIASKAVAASALGALHVNDVWTVVKKQEAMATVGTVLYWDEDGDPYGGTSGTGALTATSTAGKPFGVLIAAAAETAATCEVLKLNLLPPTEQISLPNLTDVVSAAVTSGYVLVANGTGYVGVAISGDVTLASTGAVTIAAGAVETTMIAADAITEALIADDAVEAEHVKDGEILPVGIAVPDASAITFGTATLTRSGNNIVAVLPTSDPAVAGALWSDTGTVKVSAGA